jgi:hypothetical protein
MPPKEKDPTLRQQAGSARADLVLRGAHMGIPWMLFIALTVFGNVLHLVSAHVPAVGAWLPLTIGLTAVAGTGLAGLDWHLRRSRMTAVGRNIGPVTTEAGTAMLVAFLAAGYSVPLVLLWMFGGAAACAVWDLWLAHGDRHDPVRVFAAAAEQAGLGQARLVMAGRAAPASPSRFGRARRGPAGPAVERGIIGLPPGEVTPADAAARVANLESARRLPPGAMSLSPNHDDASMTNYAISDPRKLAVPTPWPGPHAPGADMSVPFRVGDWQTGEVALVPRLPLFHTRAMGMTGSAKTMGWGYNLLGEGVTREGYAALAMDISKGNQFFGAWRPALHRFETAEDKALYLLRGIHRARLARSEYLATKHLTEWEPGCGLSWLDVIMAECPDIIRLLETAKSRMANAVMSLPDWTSDVKNSRSAGIAWNLDLQLTLADELPTVAQGQMSHLCLGVEDVKQAAFGLSARQRDAGCRPELWGKKRPGTAYWDVPTLPDEYGVMPMRFFHWEGGSRQAFAYAEQWPAEDRPLDDVTAEALAAEPAPPASHALPGPGGTVPGARPATVDRYAGNVRQLFGRQPAKPARPSREEEAAKAEQAVFDFWEGWLAGGKTQFTHLELEKTGILERLGRSRPWLYGIYKAGIAAGRIREVDGGTGRKRYEILPPAPAQAADSEEM